MIYTSRVEHAIRKASVLHDGQKRKGSGAIPYISHLFSVAVILSKYTDDEDTIIAGLLHDSIEDTEYTEKGLKEEFGGKIAAIVFGVTEEKTKNGIKLSWKERKDDYLSLLQKSSEQTLMVAAADKIHNLQSAVNDFKSTGEIFWANRDYGKSDEQQWFFGEVLAILKKKLQSKIVNELEIVFREAEVIFKKS